MQTSIKNRNESFKNQIEKFGLRRKTVYKIIESYGALTDFEIAEKMKLPVNSITGRRKELQELCLIKESGSKKNDKTNVLNTTWSVTNEAERVVLIDSKLSELIKEFSILESDLSGVYPSNLVKGLITTRIITIIKLIKRLLKFK